MINKYFPIYFSVSSWFNIFSACPQIFYPAFNSLSSYPITFLYPSILNKLIFPCIPSKQLNTTHITRIQLLTRIIQLINVFSPIIDFYADRRVRSFRKKYNNKSTKLKLLSSTPLFIKVQSLPKAEKHFIYSGKSSCNHVRGIDVHIQVIFCNNNFSRLVKFSNQS